MRLHLNKTLRAALIAAITTVGFTTFSTGTLAVAAGAALLAGQQAYAEDVTIALPTERGYQITNASGGAIAAGGNLSATITTISGDSGKLANTGVYVGGNNGSFGFDHNTPSTEAQLTLGEGGDYTLNLWGRSGKGGETVVYVLNPENLEGVAYLDSLTLNATRSCDIGIGIGLAVVRSDGSGVVSSQVADSITKNTPASVSISDLEWSSDYRILALVRGGGGGGETNSVTGITLTATPGTPSAALTWAGAVSSVWQNGSGEAWQGGTVFKNGDNVVFDSSAASTEVTLDGAITAGSVTVDSDAYTFSLSSDSLSATKLTIKGEGASLALTGEGTVSAGSIAASGKTINIGDKVVLQGGTGDAATLAGTGMYALASGATSMGSVTFGEGWTGTVRISNAGTDASPVSNLQSVLSSLGNGTKGTVEISKVVAWLGDSVSANIKLDGTGTTLRIVNGSSNKERVFSGSVSGTGDYEYAWAANNGWQTHTFTGDVSGWTGTFKTTVSGTTASNLKFSGSATDVKASVVHNRKSVMDLTFSNNNNVTMAGAISKGEGSTLNLVVDAPVTFSNTVTADSLTVNAGKSATMNGASTFTNVTLVSDATLANAGAMTINGTIIFGSSAIANNPSGSITLGNDVIFNIAGLSEVDKTYTLFSGTGDKIDLSSHGYTAANIAGVTTAGRTWTFNNDGTISYAMSASQIWTGGSTGDWDYESNNWGTPGAPFTSGSSAQFDSSANVTLVDAIVADSIIVSSGAEVNLIAGEGSSLQAQAVEVGGTLTTGMTVTGLTSYNVSEGGVWNINANQTLGSGTKAGIINVGSGARVDITENGLSVVDGMTNHGTVALALTGESKLTMNSASDGTVELSGGTLDYRSELGTQDIKLTGTKLLFGKNAGSVIDTVFDHNIVLGSATTIQVYGTSQHKSVTIKGTITGSGYELIKDDGNQTTTFEGKVTVNKFTTGDSSTGTTVIKNGAEIGNNLSPHKGTLEIHGDVSVGHELDLSSNGACTATVKIAADGAASVKDGMWMSKNAHVELLEGGKLALTNAGLSLVGRNGGGSVTTTADNGQYGVDKTTFTISGADVTATKAVTIGNKLTNSSISTGANAVTLSNTGNTLMGGTVAEGGSLSIAGGGLVGTAIANNGTLTFTGDITATGFTVTKGASGFVDVNGTFSTDGNGFEATSGDSITIVNNAPTATLTPNGHKVTQDSVVYTINANGTATSGESVRYLGYSQVDGAVNVSAIAQYAEDHDGACTAVAVSGDGVLNVDDFMAFVTANGGTVNFVEGAEVMYLSVSDDAKISGLTDFSVMMIDATKTATLDADIVAGNVFFSTVDGGVQVTNTSTDTPITYSINEESAQVTANTMTVDGDTGVEIANSLVVKEIVNNNANGLVLNGNVEDGVTLRAIGGDIVLAGQTSNTVSVVDLEIAADKMVMMPNGDDEGTITVTDTLTGGDATLLANLTLVGGSTLDVNGGDTHALTLGSTLTFDFANSAGLVNLDDETIAALNNLSEGGHLDLIVSANSELDPLKYGEKYDGMGYSDLFNRVDGLEGNYTVYAKDGAFGLMKSTRPIPEPTTGTLSLLALMALAARRRRK